MATAGTAAGRRATGGTGGLVAGAVVALLVLAPVLLQGGFVLGYDMVFVPQPPLDEALLGLGSAVARAVPSDLVVVLLSQLLPAEVVQRLVLAAVLVLGAWGAGRLLPAALPGAVAGTAYVWTAAMYERLVLGQWALLVSLAALPWVVATAAAVRTDPSRRRWALLVLALAGGAVGSPAGGLLCVAVAVVVVAAGRRVRPAFTTGALGLVLLLPWALPSLLRPGGVAADPGGLAAFAPGADTPLGTAGSLLTLGGVWNAQVVPPGRDSWAVALLGLALVAAGLVGACRLRDRTWWAPLAGCAIGGLAVALLASLPGGAELAAALPGGGLLRDGQKYAAPYALLVAVGLGALAGRVPVPAGVLLLVAPVALVPALVWGASGRLDPVDYPADVRAVRALVEADPAPAVSLPWTAYRRPVWNGRRTVLDPVPRLLGVPVLVDDDLVLGDRVVQGEDPLAAGLDDALSGGGPVAAELAAAGFGWVVVAQAEPGSEGVPGTLRGARRVHDGAAYDLWALPRSDAALTAAGPPAAPVVLADTLVLLLVLGAAASVPAYRRERG